MRRHPVVWFLSWSLAAMPLAGCERRAVASARAAAPPVSTAEAKPTADIADDDMDALMRAAFPGWRHGDPRVLHVPQRDDANASTTIRIEPKMVVKVDDAHRALVTIGEVSDENGNDRGAHSDQGTAGVYLFERRAGRWVKTRAQDAVAWAGSDGVLSAIETANLGPGRPALFVEGSYTGQGETTVWAQVVEVGPTGARVVLPDLELHEDTYGATNGDCESWARGTRTPSRAELENESGSPCHEITGKWHVEPAVGAARGDLAVVYTVHRVVDDPQTKARSFETVTETVVYRDAPTGYARLSGNEPR